MLLGNKGRNKGKGWKGCLNEKEKDNMEEKEQCSGCTFLLKVACEVQLYTNYMDCINRLG